MDLKEKIKLHRQTIEAIEACEKDKGIRLQGSNNGVEWFGPLELTGSFRAYIFYRIAKPEPKKVKYYRPVFKDDIGIYPWPWWTDKKTEFSRYVIGEYDFSKNEIIRWDEEYFNIPEEDK